MSERLCKACDEPLGLFNHRDYCSYDCWAFHAETLKMVEDQRRARRTFLLRMFLLLLGIILLAHPAWCQEIEREVIRRELPKYRPARVVFVVDASFSVVRAGTWGAQLEYVDRVLHTLPFDGAEYALVCFGATSAVNGQWVRHPSPQGRVEALSWLSSRPVNDTGTDFVSAMNNALALAGDKPTTVVWITDGAPTWVQRQVISGLLAQRDPVQVIDGRRCRSISWVFVGVGLTEYTRLLLNDMAKSVDGGFVELELKEDK